MTSKPTVYQVLQLTVLMLPALSFCGDNTTTIRDVVYSMDDKPFSGRVEVVRQGDQALAMSFEVEDGMLSIRLQSPATYEVMYVPDIGHPWREVWNVSMPGAHLALRDIRQTALPGASLTDAGSKDITLPVSEAAVTGLVASLSNINQSLGQQSAQLSTVASRLALIKGMVMPNTDNLSANANGSNKTFVLSATPEVGTLRLIWNGQRLQALADFTLNGNTVTMSASPSIGDSLVARYQAATTPSQAEARDVTLPIPQTAVMGLPSALSAIRSSLSAMATTLTALGSDLPTGTALITGEVPAGVLDGVNSVFTVANPSVPLSLEIFRNGLLETLGVDYTFSGQTITFSQNSIPSVGDTVIVDYIAQ